MSTTISRKNPGEEETQRVSANNPTIGHALEQMEATHGGSLGDFKRKQLYLRQVMLGLAEVQARRVSRLSRVVCQLEDLLLREEKLRDLEPKQLYGLYRTATESLQLSSEYIQQTLKGMDWREFETGLLEAEATSQKERQHTVLDGTLSSMQGDALLAVLADLGQSLRHTTGGEMQHGERGSTKKNV